MKTLVQITSSERHKFLFLTVAQSNIFYSITLLYVIQTTNNHACMTIYGQFNEICIKIVPGNKIKIATGRIAMRNYSQFLREERSDIVRGNNKCQINVVKSQLVIQVYILLHISYIRPHHKSNAALSIVPVVNVEMCNVLLLLRTVKPVVAHSFIVAVEFFKRPHYLNGYFKFTTSCM